MKKRLLALVLAICTLSVILCACSDENKKNEAEKTWSDTGIRTCAITFDYQEYSNKIPVSTERKALEAFFSKYEKEY